jgi:hypothetical protein
MEPVPTPPVSFSQYAGNLEVKGVLGRGLSRRVHLQLFGDNVGCRVQLMECGVRGRLVDTVFARV